MTEFEVGTITLSPVEARISQYNRTILEPFNQMMKPVVVNIRAIAIPSDNPSDIVQHDAELGSNYPPAVRKPLLAYLARTPAFPDRMKQFYAAAVDYSQHRRIGKQTLCPVSASEKTTKEPCSARQIGEHIVVICTQPAIEVSASCAFDSVKQAYGDKFAGSKGLLAVSGYICHSIIYLAEQFGDNIYYSHGNMPPLRMLSNHRLAYSRGIFNYALN